MRLIIILYWKTDSSKSRDLKEKKRDLSEDLIVLFMEFKIDLGLDIRGSEYVYFSKVVKSIKGNLVFGPRIDNSSLNQE